MMSAFVSAPDLRDPKRRLRHLAQLNNPCHIEPCDLDGDGNIDLLVTDLGGFYAADLDRGRVVWLRQDGRSGEFEEVVLASGLGRVADARPIDLEGTGKLDVVVAEFGWYRTGKILLLKNVAARGQRPRFEPEELDPRGGTVHVPVCDLNSDGRQDFLALVSNEHECVEAFLNQGNGTFHRQTLWRAPDLTFGSNGIRLVDLNGDGKIDILYTNGDAFDNDYLSPWHGVQWLENLGNMKFQYHRLTDMPGACVALAGDFRREWPSRHYRRLVSSPGDKAGHGGYQVDAFHCALGAGIAGQLRPPHARKRLPMPFRAGRRRLRWRRQSGLRRRQSRGRRGQTFWRETGSLCGGTGGKALAIEGREASYSATAVQSPKTPYAMVVFRHTEMVVFLRKWWFFRD